MKKSDIIIQVGNIMPERNFANPQCGRIYSADGISPTINTMGGGNREPKIVTDMEKELKLPEELKWKNFRIRKLTPKECFRLMGVDDADIDKMQETGISVTAQKKLAGNSIVVDVLFHLFRKLLVETEGNG